MSITPIYSLYNPYSSPIIPIIACSHNHKSLGEAAQKPKTLEAATGDAMRARGSSASGPEAPAGWLMCNSKSNTVVVIIISIIKLGM